MANYEEFINNIIATRGRFSCGEEYHERHHIVPRCLGGTNDEENLIDLFAKEHFIAHKLLAQENPENNSLVYAWSCMAFVKSDNQERYELTAEEYEEVKNVFGNAQRERMLGHIESEETRLKKSLNATQWWADLSKREEHRQKLQGRKHSEESIQKMKNSAKSRCEDLEWRKRMSESLRGREVSDTTRQLISDAMTSKNTGKKNHRSTQVYCIELDREFECLSEVDRLGIASRESVRRCILGKKQSTGIHPITGEPLHWISLKNNNINNT
jgi:hypothetical protein